MSCRAPNGAFGCTYHPLKSLAVHGSGVAIPGCESALQYALDGALVEPCEGPQGQPEFLHMHGLKSRCRAFTTVSVWLDHFSFSEMCTPRNVKLLTVSTVAPLMRLGACQAWEQRRQSTYLLPVSCHVIVVNQAYYCQGT